MKPTFLQTKVQNYLNDKGWTHVHPDVVRSLAGRIDEQLQDVIAKVVTPKSIGDLTVTIFTDGVKPPQPAPAAQPSGTKGKAATN